MGIRCLAQGHNSPWPVQVCVSLKLINYYLHLIETITSSETEIKNMFVQVKKYERTPLVPNTYSTSCMMMTQQPDFTCSVGVTVGRKY